MDGNDVDSEGDWCMYRPYAYVDLVDLCIMDVLLMFRMHVKSRSVIR